VPGTSTSRLLYIDWLRGLAVLFMFEAHLYPAWVRPSEHGGMGYSWAKIFAGYAAPLFLFLAGVGMAMAMTSGLSRGKTWEETRRTALKRGFQIFLAAFLFRVQEHLLGGGSPLNLLKVDILNCIGASMMLAATFVWPRATGLWADRAFAAAGLVMLMAPLFGRVQLPRWNPWPVTSYFIDRRTWFFPLAPWSAYVFAGLGFGTLWSRGVAPATGGRRGWIMPSMALGGAAAVLLSWLLGPKPGRIQFLFLGGTGRDQIVYIASHIGWILVAAASAFLLQRLARPARFGPVRQLGRTSLLAYWVHVDLVYGHLAGAGALNLKGQLTFAEASVGLLVLTLFVLGLSWFRTHHLGAFRAAAVFERLWAEFVKHLGDAWRRSPARAAVAAPEYRSS
jgi:uncharacterized membrane protein